MIIGIVLNYDIAVSVCLAGLDKLIELQPYRSRAVDVGIFHRKCECPCQLIFGVSLAVPALKSTAYGRYFLSGVGVYQLRHSRFKVFLSVLGQCGKCQHTLSEISVAHLGIDSQAYLSVLHHTTTHKSVFFQLLNAILGVVDADLVTMSKLIIRIRPHRNSKCRSRRDDDSRADYSLDVHALLRRKVFVF